MWVFDWIWQNVKEVGAAVGIGGVFATLWLTILNRRDALRSRSSEKERLKPFGRLHISKPAKNGWRAVRLNIHNPSGEALETEKMQIINGNGAFITHHAPNCDVNARPKPDIGAASTLLTVSWFIGLPLSLDTTFATAKHFWIKLPDPSFASKKSRFSRIVVTAKAISSRERLVEIVAPIPTKA